MSCQGAQELIHAYVDGELDLVVSLDVEQHIHECAICEYTYHSQTALRSSLKDDSLYYRAPKNLKARIQSSLREEARPKVSQRAIDWRWLTVGAALAFMLLVGVLVGRRAIRSLGPSGDELLAQAVISDHVRSLQMPGHLADVLSSDQHAVKPWFNGRVDFSPPVKDFAAQDFRLYGGRLDYLNNRTVVALIYQRRLHYINLYIWPAEQAGGTGEVTTQGQGYNLIHWTSSRMNYWAVSDLNNVELREFARLVQQGK